MYISIDEEGNFADIDNAIINPNSKYYCPQCKTELIIKNGNINIPHFAHRTLVDCETFTQDMSDWHREWQKQFQIKNREVVIEKNGEKHRADICLKNYIIEFQHSKISQTEFDRRNNFYTSAGYKVIWIFDFIEEHESGKMECYEEWYKKNDNGGKYSWKYPCKFMENWNPKSNRDIIVFFQITERRNDEDGVENNCFEKIIWVIDEYGNSNFKKFFTSYYPSNLTELKKYIINNKL